mgnify:FL=1
MSEEQSGRINQLEEALAHQEVMSHDLSDELAKQWQTIEGLPRRIKELEEKVATRIAAADAPESGDPPPPHY